MNKSFLLIGLLTIALSCNNKSKESEKIIEPPQESVKDTQSTAIEQPNNSSTSDEITILKKDTGKTSSVIFLVKNIIDDHVPDNMYDKAKEGEKFIAVQVWVKNISKSDFELDDFKKAFKLFDQDDAEYVDDTNDWNFGRKKPILVPDDVRERGIKPNQSKSGWLTFTTPKNSKAIKMQYEGIIIKL